MADRGLRSVLQPALYFGAAFLLHALLFLVPLGGMGRPDAQTTRGIRVKIIAQGPVLPRTAPPAPPVAPSSQSPNQTPQSESAKSPAAKNTVDLQPGSGGQGSPGGGDAAGSKGEPGNAPSMSEYGRYLAKLRSEGVQGWARDTARSSKHGWKGTGVGGWGGGSGEGKGAGKGAGSGGPGGSGDGILDPRVRMVVNSYPSTGIERNYTPVSYPDLKIKKHQYTSGWWNVYIEIRTNETGKIVRFDVLRPETDGPLEKLFVRQVTTAIEQWRFDPVAAEIHVDVRFYVE